MAARRRCSGGEAVAAWLAAAGIDTVISIPGSQTLPLWDALRSATTRLVVPRGERHAGFMAEGYGRFAARPAVLASTLGPGVANELPALASAYRGQVPLLAVAPWQPARKRRRLDEVFQGFDHPRYFQGSCKWIAVVDAAAELLPTLDRALAEAMAAPSGPVRVEVAFPLLFARATYPLPRPCTATTRHAPAAEVPIATVADRLGAAPGIVAPGLGRDGDGLPFALGVWLARRHGAVLVHATATTLVDHIDTLQLADQHGAHLRVVVGGHATVPAVVDALALPLVQAEAPFLPGELRVVVGNGAAA